MDLFCLFQRDYMNTAQASVQKGLIGQSLGDFQQDVLSIEIGMFYLKFVHFLKLFFFFNINWKRPKNKEFENTSIIGLELYNFAAFSYSVNFVLGVGPVYIIRVYKYCFFMHLYISRVTSKIIISLSHIFNFSFVLFSTRQIFLQLGNICGSSIFVALTFLSLYKLLSTYLN